MILEGLAALFGLALLSGSDEEEKKKKLIKKEKKEIAQKMIGLLKIALEEKMEKRGEYFEKNLKEQYNNIKITNITKENTKINILSLLFLYTPIKNSSLFKI